MRFGLYNGVMVEARPTLQHAAAGNHGRSAKHRLALLLLAVALVASTSCKRTKPKAAAAPVAASAGTGQSLRQLRRIWSLPGFEATHSLLSVVPTGSVFLAVSQSGDRAWDLAALDIQRGKVLWRSPLAGRAGIALSVIGDQAVVHDQAGSVTAHDLATGRQAWTTKLDCEIQEGDLTAVSSGVAVGRCQPGRSSSTGTWQVDWLALDLEAGAVIWRKPQPSPYGKHHFVDGKLLAHARKAPLPRALKDPNALVGSRGSEWTIVEVLTGKTLPPAVLARSAEKSSLVGPDPLLVAGPMFPGSVSFYKQNFAFFTQGRKGATPRREPGHRDCSTQFGAGCTLTPLHALTRVLRAGRMFRIDCREIVEFSPTTEEALGTWPITGGAGFFEPWLAALDVHGARVTAVISSRHPREVGRVVTFNGQDPPIISKAPGIDPDLVGLSQGVLVAQEGPHLGGPVDPGDPSQRPAKALVGYSLLEPGPEDADAGDPDLEHLRQAITGRGTIDAILCEQWQFQFDGEVTAKLRAIPRWEEHLVRLFHDRDLYVQQAAFAAAVHLRTPSLAQALMQVIAPLPPLDTSTRSRDQIWWARDPASAAMDARGGGDGAARDEARSRHGAPGRDGRGAAPTLLRPRRRLCRHRRPRLRLDRSLGSTRGQGRHRRARSYEEPARGMASALRPSQAHSLTSAEAVPPATGRFGVGSRRRYSGGVGIAI